MFETFVVSEILKSWWHRGKTPPVYFYRDRDRREVDLLIDANGALHPIEIKTAATVRPQWQRVFQPLQRLDKPLAPGAVICLAPESVPLNAGVTALPLAAV